MKQDELKAEFAKRFGDDAQPRLFSAPGRVNLIGEHTDYNDGFVLPFAIDRRTVAVAAVGIKGVIRAYSTALDQFAEFEIADTNKPSADWAVYLWGVIQVLRRRGIEAVGTDILIDSDIPFGAGLSSSAALEICVGAALAGIAGKPIEMRELAFAGREVEIEVIGVRSGIMDQFASALSVADNLTMIDCRELTVRHVPIDLSRHKLLVCDTGVKHSLASSEYNKRREECELGVSILAKHLPDIRSLRDVDLTQLNALKEHLPDETFRRCRHVVSENDRVLDSVGSIDKGDLAELGRLMYHSHESLRDDYEVSCDELDELVDAARSVAGVVGARMTGGGFGGATINLVESGAVDGFKAEVTERYSKRFGRGPEIFEVRPSDGARAIDV